MVGLYCASFAQVATRIILAIDDSFDAVHGGRQLRLFNAHCDDCGFPPIVVFDGAGRFATAVLRPAKRREIRSHWPRGEILLRARAARAAAAHDADLTTAAPARPETATPEPNSPNRAALRAREKHGRHRPDSAANVHPDRQARPDAWSGLAAPAA